MKAHTMEKTEELPDGDLVAHVERLPGRRLCCGKCGCPSSQGATMRRPARRWQDLALRNQPLWLVYGPHRPWCPQCGLRVERVSWAEKWQRVTHALSRAVATLARRLYWASLTAHFRLNWKTIASVVEAAVPWGLAHRRWAPLRVVGIDRFHLTRYAIDAAFTKLAKTTRTHREGILAWTKLRVTNGALEAMNNKVKAISHRAFGFRTMWTYIANIYHCCAGLPLP